MTKLYASSSGAASSQNVSCVPAQEEVVIEPYDRLLREIRNQLDEFPIGETVLVGNCPPDISDEEIHGFFHGFATAVRLKRVCAKVLTTTLYIAKFDSAESASRSKVLHTLSLKEKKILLLQLEDRQLFGKNHVVELNGFQDHPEEVIYDHMSAFGQVNFILKTKNAAYVVYEEPSSVEASSRCEYLDQYPVTIRSVLDTSIGSGTSASASGIESCILEQLDQHESLLVEEDEGQINNFMQLLDMDNLDEYMELNEQEKSVVIDKPLLEVGNEEIIANEDEDAASVADVAAIEKQALKRDNEPAKRRELVGEGCVLVDKRSALQLKLDGNMLRLSDLPQLRVRVQKASAKRKKKKYKSTPDKQFRTKDSGDSKSKPKSSEGGTKKSKKDKPNKVKPSGDAKKEETPKVTEDPGVKSEKLREKSPAKKSSKDKPKKEERSKSNDVVEPEPNEVKGSKESPPKKPSKEQPKKERSRSAAHSTDVQVKIEPGQSVVEASKTEKVPSTPKAVSENVKQDPVKERKPVVVLKRLTAKQLEDLSIVRRESPTKTAAIVVNEVEKDQPKERKQEKGSEEKRRREKEKRKRSKASGESSEAKRRKNDDDGSGSKELEKKQVVPADAPVVLELASEPVVKKEENTPMEVEAPVVVEEAAPAKEVVAKPPDLSSTLLSDDEEHRLVIDLPPEAKPAVEKPVEVKVVEPEPIKPPKQNRVVVKLDTRSAAILHDKVHDSFLLHLDVLSRVLIKLNKISTAGYERPKPPAKISKPVRKSPVEVPAKKREDKPPPEKVRKTDLEKIDNKFLPAGSKLKSQARVKSKHESSHKKQHHHHVPVPELPVELKKSHLNTSFKIPKKNSHSSKPAANAATSRSELECLHREDEERERQRKRFQKEQKRPEDRPRSKKPTAPQVEQPRSNTPDYFDPTWDDDGGGGGDASPLPEQKDPPPREQENTGDGGGWKAKKPFVPGGTERDKDKKGPSFRDIWNLPPEKPKVWEKEPWSNNSGTIDSGELWSAEERANQAVPVLPLFAQEPTNNQRSNSTIDAGDSWSPGGGASPVRPNSSTERRPPPRASAKTIGDGESWSPEADTSKKITALNLDQRRRPPSRQDEMPRKPQPPPQRRLESPAPRGGIGTISSGDMWDTDPAGFGIKPDPSKENIVPDHLSDPMIRGASHDRSENSWSNDRFRGGRSSPGMDERGRPRSREQSSDRKRRRSPGWSPERRPWARDQSPARNRDARFDRSLDRSPPLRRGSLNPSPGRRPSLDHHSRDGSFNRSPGPLPSSDHGRFERSLDRRNSLERRHWPRETSPRRGLSSDRRNSPSPEGRPTRAWSPFGSGVGGAGKRRSQSRSPLRRFLGRVSRSPEALPRQSPVRRGAARFRSRSPEALPRQSPVRRGAARFRSRSPEALPRQSPVRRGAARFRSRSPEEPTRQSPVRRGAARFRSRSRSRDRHDEGQNRKRSRSPPPARHQRQQPREASRERSREGSSGLSGRGRRGDEFGVDRNVLSSRSPDLWDDPVADKPQKPTSTDRTEPTKRLDDDEIPYSPSNFLDEGVNTSTLLETIPLQLPLMAKSSPKKQLEQSATEEQPASKESTPQIRVKQEQLLTPQESTPKEDESVAGTAVEKPGNVKLEKRPTTESVQTGAANVTDPEQPSQEESAPEQLSALTHLKQRAERLKKLEEMKLARQKLMVQMKMQKETEKVPQAEKQEQQQVLQPEPVARKMLKVEPPAEQTSTPAVTDIKREQQQPQQQDVDPSAASLLLETAVSILSNFGHLLPSIAAAANPATPPLPPPLPAEAPKPPLPDEPSPDVLPPAAVFPPATVAPPSIWEPPGFAQMPDLGQPPPFNVHRPPQPLMPFEEAEQQQFQDFRPMEQDNLNGRSGCFQENNYDDWQSQGPNFETGRGRGYDDQSQSFNYDDEPNWDRRPAQDYQPFNDDGPDSWQQQPNYFNNQQQNQQQEEMLQLLPPEEFRAQRNKPSNQQQNQQQEEMLQLLPPEEFRAQRNKPSNQQQNQQQEEMLHLLPPEEFLAQRNKPSQQFDGGLGGNQRHRDPRQRFRGNNRGHNNNNSNNNNAFRDPRRNRGGSIYTGGGFPQQQQQQQGQQWNRNNNNNNFNRGGGGGGQFGNQQWNRNNSWKQGNQRRGGGFKNFQQRSQQQQQQLQQMGDEFLLDGDGDGSNWDDFMQ
uniref:RRM domain-containing protein n=1 Tax=Culex tarsalis TaxID=7177 RepID=A0A1Q3FW35_CULTA